MVIYTAKLSRPKLIGILLAAAAVLALVIILANRPGSPEAQPAGSTKLATPESRVEFLASCGCTVAADTVRTQEVRIPETFNEVYAQYNAIQRSQGLDLSRYQGKAVMQYVYQVVPEGNDPGEPVYATLLLYKNKLIGADLTKNGPEGFLRPLLAA